MNRRFLFWDVDTQYDFMDPEGKLPVPDARSIVPNLEKLTRFAEAHRIPIISSADAHPPDDPEFEEFGAHCVIGARGQKKIDAALVRGAEVVVPEYLDEQITRLSVGRTPQLIIEKQELDVFSVPAAGCILSRREPHRVFVYGVATEYCVLRTVMGLLNRGIAVTVCTDAVRAIDRTKGERALAGMREAGADLAETEAVLERVEATLRA